MYGDFTKPGVDKGMSWIIVREDDVYRHKDLENITLGKLHHHAAGHRVWVAETITQFQAIERKNGNYLT